MNLMHWGFLAAGAAAMTLPLWIHLLLRQRAMTIDIGSIRFVKQVVRRTRSRQRIQRWLLLALRAIAVLLLGILFARPFLPDTPADGSTREVAILIDRSASMSAQIDDSGTSFQAAIRRAKDYVGTLGDACRVHLGVFDSSGVQPTGLEDLDAVSVASTGTGYADAFAWAADLLSASERADREVFLLSDLQRVAGVQASVSGFPSDLPVRIGDPASPIAQNVAVESAVATQVEIRPSVPVTMMAQVVNHGAIPIIDLPFRIELNGPDGVIVLDQTLTLAAGERKSIRQELPIKTAGLFFGSVTVDHDDPFLWDNNRAIAFQTRFPDRMLLVDGDAARQAWESETYFLETAFRLQSAVGEGPARTFEVERLVWDRGSGFPDLAGFRLIVLANLSRFTHSDATRLKTFVEAGGNVLWFPGERSTDVVHERLRQSGLLGKTEIGRAVDAVARVNAFDAAHPALKPFADPQHGDLRTLVASRLIPIASTDPESEVLMRSRRWPLIVSHSYGAGRLVFVATSADRGWNDWPPNPIFVPLMRQLAAWLTGQLDEGPSVQTEVIADAEQVPGIKNVEGRMIVRNVDSAESEIGRYTADQFRELAGLDKQSVITVESERREQLAPAGVARSDEKWPLVIWALLGILSCELILASRVHE